MSRENVHTVYDRMAAKGIFRQNPANRDAIDPLTGQANYQPADFPKMLYHPKGKRRITNPAEMVNTPFGPQRNNEQTELINKIVKNEAELDAALKEGWHLHPSDAVAAGFSPADIEAGLQAPPKSAASRMTELEKEIARLHRELAAAQSGPVQDDKANKDAEEE